MKSVPLQRTNSVKFRLAGFIALAFIAQLALAQNPLAGSSTENTTSKLPKASSKELELEIDRQHLQHIYRAISAYYKDHQDLPDWLSDLVPRYLADENDLVSPVEKRT